MLGLMVEKLNSRHKAISETMSGKAAETMVTDEQLFEQLGNKIKVVR